jgi:hypothetical protein
MNIGDLAKPATTLIEKVADFTGAYFLPHQMIRVAKAKAEAGKIKAFADLEISEIQKRGLIRLINEEERNQDNIEIIVAGSLAELNENAKPEEIEDDWFANFFSRCKLNSDVEMQSLWSKLLAGEANNPGIFSKRTIQFVSNLDKRDAELFTILCCFIWKISDSLYPLIYFDEECKIYENKPNPYQLKGLTYDKVLHLESIGLIKFQSITGFKVSGLANFTQVFYHGIPINIEFQTEEKDGLRIGNVVLTQTGLELAPICGSKEVSNFLESVLDEWQKFGYITSSPFPKTI